jgi:hypothetical protein
MPSYFKYMSFVFLMTLLFPNKGYAGWSQYRVRERNGDAGCFSISAKFQIVTETWERVVAVPYIVYMPERNRLLMLVSCDYPHQAMVLWSNDLGDHWSSPKYVHTGSDGKPDTGMGVALAYLGEGKVTLLANHRWISGDYGETWTSLGPIPPVPGGATWNVWDPLFVEHEGKTGKVVRLLETGYSMDHARWASAAGPGYSQGYIRSSTDTGRTWSLANKVPEWYGVSEVALARAQNGDLVAACRTDKPEDFPETMDHFEGLAVSVSKDDGESWSALNRLYSWGRHHPSMVVMPDGKIVMTYVVRKGYTTSGDEYQRFGIEAVVSVDHGQTWDLDHKYILRYWNANRKDENSWWASSQATSTVLLPDGSILTTFGTGYRSQPAEKGPSPRDVGLIRWRLIDRPTNQDRRIRDAAFDSDIRNVFDPDIGGGGTPVD